MNVRLLVVPWVCMFVLAVACSGDGARPANGVSGGPTRAAGTPGPRPAGVPASARPLDADVEFGAPSVAAGADPSSAELFYSASCADGVLAVVTTRRVVYAELPCDRALPASAKEPFLGKPIHLRVAIATPGKLYFDSSAAGSVEFTVGRVWLAGP